jgi:hypothetical protein
MTDQQTRIDEDDNPFLKPELIYLAEEDYQLPPADPALLASANRMLHDRLERVARVLRGCGLEKLKDITGSDDLQMATAALAGAYQMATADVDGLMAALIDKDKALFVARSDADFFRRKLGVPGRRDMTFDEYWDAEMGVVGAKNYLRKSVFYAVAQRAWDAAKKANQGKS